MSYIDDLEQAAAEALAASSSATDSAQIIADVANGDENTTVTTANGEVKTLAKAIKDIIDSIEAGVEAPQVEPQTLSAGQTTVTLSTMTTEGIAVYVEGSREFDFTVVNSADFEFGESFPDGTRIWVVKRDIEGVADSFTVNTSTGSQTLSNALDQRVIYVNTLADLQALPTGGLVDGQGLKITTTGRAGDFVVRVGDFQADVNDDPCGIVWTQFDGTPASSMAAMRVYNRWEPLPIEWADGETDNSAVDNSTPYDNLSLYIRDVLGGGAITLGAGDYYFTKITLRDYVSVIGQGQDTTNILPLAATSPGGTDPNYGLIEQDAGRVRGVKLCRLSVWGNQSKINSDPPINSDQWGFYLRAKWDEGFNDGGLWDPVFDDIRAPGWKYGMWSRGGYTTAHSLLPQQWFDFRKLSIICSDVTGEPLRMTGQHGQCSFTGSGRAEFAFGGGTSDNYNVTIDWDPAPSEVATGQNGESTGDTSGAGNAVRAPSGVTLGNGFTIQLGKGVYARNNKGCYLDGAWIEKTKGGVFADATGHISVTRTRFADAGSDTGVGYLCKTGPNASVDWGPGNDIFGSFDNFFVSTTGTQRKFSLSHDGWVYTDGLFNGGFFQLNASETLDVRGNGYAVVNVSDHSIEISGISSTMVPGQNLSLRVVNGNLRLRNTGNIRFPAGWPSTKVFPANSTVTLVRVLDSKEWHLVTPEVPFYASAEPADGYYYHIGTRVWNVTGASGQPMGWVCNQSGIAGSTASFNAMANVT